MAVERLARQCRGSGPLLLPADSDGAILSDQGADFCSHRYAELGYASDRIMIASGAKNSV